MRSLLCLIALVGLYLGLAEGLCKAAFKATQPGVQITFPQAREDENSHVFNAINVTFTGGLSSWLICPEENPSIFIRYRMKGTKKWDKQQLLPNATSVVLSRLETCQSYVLQLKGQGVHKKSKVEKVNLGNAETGPAVPSDLEYQRDEIVRDDFLFSWRSGGQCTSSYGVRTIASTHDDLFSTQFKMTVHPCEEFEFSVNAEYDGLRSLPVKVAFLPLPPHLDFEPSLNPTEEIFYWNGTVLNACEEIRSATYTLLARPKEDAPVPYVRLAEIEAASYFDFRYEGFSLDEMSDEFKKKSLLRPCQEYQLLLQVEYRGSSDTIRLNTTEQPFSLISRADSKLVIDSALPARCEQRARKPVSRMGKSSRDFETDFQQIEDILRLDEEEDKVLFGDAEVMEPTTPEPAEVISDAATEINEVTEVHTEDAAMDDVTEDATMDDVTEEATEDPFEDDAATEDPFEDDAATEDLFEDDEATEVEATEDGSLSSSEANAAVTGSYEAIVSQGEHEEEDYGLGSDVPALASSDDLAGHAEVEKSVVPTVIIVAVSILVLVGLIGFFAAATIRQQKRSQELDVKPEWEKDVRQPLRLTEEHLGIAIARRSKNPGPTSSSRK